MAFETSASAVNARSGLESSGQTRVNTAMRATVVDEGLDSKRARLCVAFSGAVRDRQTESATHLAIGGKPLILRCNRNSRTEAGSREKHIHVIRLEVEINVHRYQNLRRDLMEALGRKRHVKLRGRPDKLAGGMARTGVTAPEIAVSDVRASRVSRAHWRTPVRANPPDLTQRGAAPGARGDGGYLVLHRFHQLRRALHKPPIPTPDPVPDALRQHGVTGRI